MEYRYPIVENWKAALFGDAGNATDDLSADLLTSAGVGVVWASPVGPIRLYLAKPFDTEKNKITLHIMIGPEL